MMKKIVSAAALLLAVVICFTACKSDEAKNVNSLINAIGKVSLASDEAIVKAEEAYAALTDEQKAEVSKYGKLQDARADYEKLVQIDVIDKAIEACAGAKEAKDAALFWQNALAADKAYKALPDGSYNKSKYVDYLKNTFLEYGISTLTSELESSTQYSAMAEKRDVINSSLALAGDEQGNNYEGYAALKEGFTEVDTIIAEAQTAAKTYYTLFKNFYNKEKDITVTGLHCKSENLNGKMYFVFSISYKTADGKEKSLYANSIFGAQHTVETLASSYENYFKETPASENYDAALNGNITINLEAIISGEAPAEESTTTAEETTAAEITTAAESGTAAQTTADTTTASADTTVAAETTQAETTQAAESTAPATTEGDAA